MWLEFITASVNIQLSRCRSLARREIFRCLAYSPPMCTKRRFNCTRDFAPASHAILATTDCLCPTARCERLAKFFELLNALVTSLQLRETFHQSSDLAALLQFAFRSLMIFHVFSQSLNHVALFHGLVHIRCNIVTYLECHNVLTPFHYVCEIELFALKTLFTSIEKQF